MALYTPMTRDIQELKLRGMEVSITQEGDIPEKLSEAVMSTIQEKAIIQVVLGFIATNVPTMINPSHSSQPTAYGVG